MNNNTILNEHILTLIFESISWDVDTLCRISSVSKKLKAVSDRILFRQLCIHRAPRMIETLTETNKIGGGWPALSKLLFYCCGCATPAAVSGHFTGSTRFSKTSGRSFLYKKCRGDLLYVTDPCEHSVKDKEYCVGVYRGVFKGFSKSKTRGFLNRRHLEDEEKVRCPYCGARVWSMTSAQLIPKSAANRLGSHDGGVEYFVCVNGHLYGTCLLVPLSSDENHDDDDDGPSDDGLNEDGLSNLLLNNGSTDSFIV